MEDAVLFQQLTDVTHLLMVCDGHGGAEVAQLVAKILPNTLKTDTDFKAGKYSSAISNTFKKVDEVICSAKGEEDLRSLNKALGGKKIEPDDKVGYRAGTTCLVLLLTKDKYYVGNVGDSRAVLSRNSKAVALSTDHKPDSAGEKERIENAGGYVHNGRVNNSLALSRALGDFEFKHFSNRSYEEQAVISVPDVL